MEKIILNGIENKGKDPNKPMWVVGFDIIDGVSNQQATLGHWQTQEANFLMKDVGIRGTCEVEITQKGQYTNITKVNMTNGTYTKGAVTNDVISKVQETQPTYSMDNSDRQKSIEAQCILKVLVEFADLQRETIDKTIQAFNYIKEKL